MNGTVQLRRARPGEAEPVSALALRSKGHWGYSAGFLAACRAELTYTEEQLRDVVVAEVDGVVAGFSSLVVDGRQAELDSLFVDPPWIGTGVGGRLLTDALARAGAAGARTVVLDADPGAEAFYLHHGARTVGTTPSGSIPGRRLPRLRFTLADGEDASGRT